MQKTLKNAGFRGFSALGAEKRKIPKFAAQCWTALSSGRIPQAYRRGCDLKVS